MTSPSSGGAASTPVTDSSGSFMIDLRIYTSDPRRREVIKRYWRLDDSGSDFAEPLEEIKDDFGLSRGGIVGIVRADSTAVSGIHRCSKCGGPKIFDCRKDFRETPKQKPFTCEDCSAAEAHLEAATEGQIFAEGSEEERVSEAEETFEGSEFQREEETRTTAAGADSKAELEMNPTGRSLMSAAQKLAEASRHLEDLARQESRSDQK